MSATPQKSKASRTRKPKAETLPMTQAIVQYAKAKNIASTDRAGKAMRSRIRAILGNEDARDAFVKAWPALADRSKGDRYNEIPVAAFDGLVNSTFTK